MTVTLPLDTAGESRELLETLDVVERLRLALSLQRERLAELQVRRRIRDDVESGAQKQQREYFLRKQLDSIRKELGEDEASLVDEYRTKIDEAAMPDKVHEQALRELDRLERMGEASGEASMIRSYLDWLLAVPWAKRSDERLDPALAREILDADPGRLVRALRDAGTMNPVIMLDEVDKVGADWRGDPSAALLEVLDPAQNHSFRDHYLDVELDLGTLLRKTATKIASGNSIAPVVVDLDAIREALGRQKVFHEAALRTAVPGVATGLSVTGAGGDVLFIEATSMEGKDGLVLTGQLGDVMKESARIALSYVRGHADELGIDRDTFHDRELHVHVPAGAIPKDGPSAGITMTTALASLLSGRPITLTSCSASPPAPRYTPLMGGTSP